MATQQLGPPDDLQSETEHLAAIINHIVLPPKLPQSEDVNLTEIEDAILRLAQRVALTLLTTLSTKDRFTWQPVVGMLSDWSEIKQGGDLRDDILISKFSKMSPGGSYLYQDILESANMLQRLSCVALDCPEFGPLSP